MPLGPGHLWLIGSLLQHLLYWPQLRCQLIICHLQRIYVRPGLCCLLGSPGRRRKYGFSAQRSSWISCISVLSCSFVPLLYGRLFSYFFCLDQHSKKCYVSHAQSIYICISDSSQCSVFCVCWAVIVNIYLVKIFLLLLSPWLRGSLTPSFLWERFPRAPPHLFI